MILLRIVQWFKKYKELLVKACKGIERVYYLQLGAIAQVNLQLICTLGMFPIVQVHCTVL